MSESSSSSCVINFQSDVLPHNSVATVSCVAHGTHALPSRLAELTFERSSPRWHDHNIPYCSLATLPHSGSHLSLVSSFFLQLLNGSKRKWLSTTPEALDTHPERCLPLCSRWDHSPLIVLSSLFTQLPLRFLGSSGLSLFLQLSARHIHAFNVVVDPLVIEPVIFTTVQYIEVDTETIEVIRISDCNCRHCANTRATADRLPLAKRSHLSLRLYFSHPHFN